jgi:drug/metabolite transporter (DMT)-like permease
MATPTTMSGRDWSLILILSVLWGGAFFFNVIGLQGLPSNTLVFVRMAAATLPLLLWLRIKGLALPSGWTAWRGLALLALLNIVIPFILFTWAQTKLSSGLTSVLNATTPLWGVIAAHFLTQNEKATPLRLAGVALGIAGVTVMILPDLRGGFGGNALAQTACLIATLSYALASIVALRLNTGGMTPMSLATGQIVAAAVIMLPIILITDQPWTIPVPGHSVIWAMLGLAILSTSLAYILYFKLLESAGASNSLIVTFLIPVTATMLGVLFLGEHVTVSLIAGSALIALGLVALDGRILRSIGTAAASHPQS